MANYQPGRMAEKSMFYGASEAPRIHGVHTNGKYDRAPRFKNQYFVAFKFNEVHTTFNAEEMRHITYRVKSFDAPKFQIDTEELNQYNKRRIIPTKIPTIIAIAKYSTAMPPNKRSESKTNNVVKEVIIVRDSV